MSTLPLDCIMRGDCEEVLKDFPSSSIDLIMTSPPYAQSRKRVYGGIAHDHYKAWFMPKAEQFYRILKPTGTFILNIKENVVKGERHPYVLELILALKAQGWLWTEEWIWHKKNSYPGKWPNRFRDAWERCLQFNKTRQFYMDQEAVRIPVKPSTQARVKKTSLKDEQKSASQTKSGFTRTMAHWKGRESVYPSNVLYLATECSNKGHSAVFPQSLPAWFIKLFTATKGLVLDPFAGSGTTALAAQALNRHYVGIDIHIDYCKQAERALQAPPKP